MYEQPALTPERPQVSEWRSGWVVLLACFLAQMICIQSLMPYTTGMFIHPLQQEFGWSRLGLSLSITVITIVSAIMAPITGWLMGRINPRVLILSGLVAGGASYVVLSLMGSSILFFYVIIMVMAIGIAGSSPVTISRVLVQYFEGWRGAALGITMVGTGVTSILAPLFLGPIIATEGWRAGYRMIALLVLGAAVIVAILFSVAGRPPAPAPIIAFDSATEEPIDEKPPFVTLMIAFLCIAFAAPGAVIHFVPMLIDAGNAPAHAAQLASLLGISLIVGRLITGFALDRMHASRLAAWLMGTSALGFLILSATGSAYLLLAAPLVGASLGAEMDLMPYLASRYYKPGRFGRVFGWFYAAFLIGAASSPMMYAFLRQIGGDYHLAFFWSGVNLVIAMICFMKLPSYPHRAAAPL
ncbi:MAG: transporter [Bradyrhizobium sp.]|nr:transporter [Bradyrhizobium sp.]